VPCPHLDLLDELVLQAFVAEGMEAEHNRSAIMVSATGKPVRITTMRAGNIQRMDIRRSLFWSGE
jgi:hypothetical protein